jgi:lipoyl(octanoyl) transferase
MKKLAAIGIHVTGKGISSHGFALNVDPDLTHFEGIVPCGIQDYGVTSMSAILDSSLSIVEVLPHVVESFADILSLEIQKEGNLYANH